jgi:hypothetical protein
VDVDEILYGDDDIIDDLDCILFNPVASTISKWWPLILVSWAQILNRMVDLDEILYGLMELNIISAMYYLIP